jgi:hypothetical protein
MEQAQLQIPAVYTVSYLSSDFFVNAYALQHDLAAFHHTHICQRSNSEDCPPLCNGVEDEVPYDEDDLGYYADGVKRTLTEEQVAMFRFSEVQQLLSTPPRFLLVDNCFPRADVARWTIEKRRREEAARKRGRESAAAEEVNLSNTPRPVVSPEDARKNRLEAALWASKHDWDEYGNPVESSDAKQQQYIAEVQGSVERGKTFLWPKIDS